MVLGIDIGGTQLRAALVDDAFEILEVCKVPNDRSMTCEENMDRLLDFAAGMNCKLDGIGIGSPGPLDVEGGRILYPPNLVGWDDFSIVDYVEQKTGMRAALNNDGNVAALAEAVLGSGKGSKSVVYVTVSTGIGGGFVYKGEIVSGANCNAAELWNLIVSDDDHCHKNANPGSLNEQCSGSGLCVLASEHYGEPTDAATLFERYYAGDDGAASIVEHGAEMLGRGIANITCMIDPDVIVIGGSVARYNPSYIELCLSKARRYLVHPDALVVREAAFGDEAGLIGAAILATGLSS